MIPVRDPFIVRRKLKWCFPPGTKPSFAKTRVDNPAVAVPRAVFAIAAATITPSPSCVMCPWIKKNLNSEKDLLNKAGFKILALG